MIFYPIRIATEYFGCRHEAGHAAFALDVFGEGSVRFVSRERCQLCSNDHRVEDLLGLCAAGMAGCEAFGAQFNQGAADIRQAEALMRSLPGGTASTHWQAARERAKEVIRRRLAFVDELGTMLEREVDELWGDNLDRLWSKFYPNNEPTYRQPYHLQRTSMQAFDDEPVFQDGYVAGVVRRHDNGQYLAIARGSLGLRVAGPTREAAAKGLLNLLDKEKIRFRTDGRMGAFV
jgi:hypothetical protein